MTDKSNNLSEQLKVHGSAIRKSMKNLSEAIKRDPVIKYFGEAKAKSENKDG